MRGPEQFGVKERELNEWMEQEEWPEVARNCARNCERLMITAQITRLVKAVHLCRGAKKGWCTICYRVQRFAEMIGE